MNISDLSLSKIPIVWWLFVKVSPIREVIVSRSERNAGICCSCSCSSSTAPRLFSQCAHSITISPSTVWQRQAQSFVTIVTTPQTLNCTELDVWTYFPCLSTLFNPFMKSHPSVFISGEGHTFQNMVMNTFINFRHLWKYSLVSLNWFHCIDIFVDIYWKM